MSRVDRPIGTARVVEHQRGSGAVRERARGTRERTLIDLQRAVDRGRLAGGDAERRAAQGKRPRSVHRVATTEGERRPTDGRGAVEDEGRGGGRDRPTVGQVALHRPRPGAVGVHGHARTHHEIARHRAVRRAIIGDRVDARGRLDREIPVSAIRERGRRDRAGSTAIDECARRIQGESADGGGHRCGIVVNVGRTGTDGDRRTRRDRPGASGVEPSAIHDEVRAGTVVQRRSGRRTGGHLTARINRDLIDGYGCGDRDRVSGTDADHTVGAARRDRRRDP